MEENFSNLRFEHRQWFIPQWVFSVSLIVVLFGLFWFLFPPGMRFWFVMLMVLVLSIGAVHGWRQALVSIGLLFRADL